MRMGNLRIYLTIKCGDIVSAFHEPPTEAIPGQVGATLKEQIGIVKKRIYLTEKWTYLLSFVKRYAGTKQSQALNG